MIVLFAFFPAKPEDSGEPEPAREHPDDDDNLFDYRLQAFDEMGFDYLSALALAWNRVSPSDVRERFLRKGATHEFVLAEFLGD